MSPLRDTSRRQICLAAFFALCVVPTVIVLACGIARHLPGHARAEAKRLGRHLGQKVSVARVRHLRPGVLVYEGLDLSDPETGKPLARCRRLEVRWERVADPKGPSRQRLALAASQAEIDAADLKSLWRLVHGALTGRLACFQSPLRLTAHEVTLRQGEIPLTLTGLEGGIARLSDGSRADVAFRVVGFETPKPVQIRIVRSHQSEPATTSGGLYTGEGALPCSLLELGFPELEALGPECQFRGYLWISESPQGWGGELAGQFAGVDLERLVAAHSSHTLRGSAAIRVEQALFRQGRLQEATGWLTAGPGVISRSLVDAAADRLGIDRAGAIDGSEQPVPYDRLAVSFRIDSGGLQLRGECPPPGSGAILVSRYDLLLREPMVQPVPIAAVLHALVPTAHVQVPATRETDGLTRRLPIPHATAPRMAEAPSPVPR
jgi:hypothetical protein